MDNRTPAEIQADVYAELDRLGMKHTMTEAQRAEIVKGVDQYLNNLKSNRFLYDYHVKADLVDMTFVIHVNRNDGPFTFSQPKKREASELAYKFDPTLTNSLLDKEE